MELNDHDFCYYYFFINIIINVMHTELETEEELKFNAVPLRNKVGNNNNKLVILLILSILLFNLFYF